MPSAMSSFLMLTSFTCGNRPSSVPPTSRGARGPGACGRGAASPGGAGGSPGRSGRSVACGSASSPSPGAVGAAQPVSMPAAPRHAPRGAAPTLPRTPQDVYGSWTEGLPPWGQRPPPHPRSTTPPTPPTPAGKAGHGPRGQAQRVLGKSGGQAAGRKAGVGRRQWPGSCWRRPVALGKGVLLPGSGSPGGSQARPQATAGRMGGSSIQRHPPAQAPGTGAGAGGARRAASPGELGSWSQGAHVPPGPAGTTTHQA